MGKESTVTKEELYYRVCFVKYKHLLSVNQFKTDLAHKNPDPFFLQKNMPQTRRTTVFF